jgi:hypothetical protein
MGDGIDRGDDQAAVDESFVDVAMRRYRRSQSERSHGA